MAYWVHMKSGYFFFGEYWECSDCGEEIQVTEDHDLPEECPGCGANMMEVQENEDEQS